MADTASSINIEKQSEDSIPRLRTARAALVEAVADGAGYLAGLRDEVEDELIAALGEHRRRHANRPAAHHREARG